MAEKVAAECKVLKPGTALYIFGPTGPSFSLYSITLDSAAAGTYNPSTTTTTYHTLLFFTTNLDASKTHSVIMRNEVDGAMVALDYVVIASPAAASSGSGATTVSTSGPSQTSQPAFPGAAAGTGIGGGSDAAGAIVGGIIGGLLALVSRASAAQKMLMCSFCCG